MSKSLGNFFTVRDVAKEFDYEVIRFFMLSAHYRSPINFSKNLMDSAKSALDRIYTCMETLKFLSENSPTDIIKDEEKEIKETFDGYKQKFIDAMEDDLNTADAISELFEIVGEANKKLTAESEPSKEILGYALSMLKELGGVLGLLSKSEEGVPAEVRALLDERQTARAEKNWAKSDEIRDKLKEMGYAVKDTPKGQQLSRI